MVKKYYNLAKSFKKVLTPGKLLIAIGITLFLGRTLDLVDPYGVHYKLLIDWLSVLAAGLFFIFIYIAFSKRRNASQSKVKK